MIATFAPARRVTVPRSRIVRATRAAAMRAAMRAAERSAAGYPVWCEALGGSY